MDSRKWPEDEPNVGVSEGEAPEDYSKLGYNPLNDPTELLRTFTNPEIPAGDHIMPECRTSDRTASSKRKDNEGAILEHRVPTKTKDPPKPGGGGGLYGRVMYRKRNEKHEMCEQNMIRG
jgi:hypothetical protein